MEINNDEAFIKKAVNYSRIVFIIDHTKYIFDATNWSILFNS